MEKRKHMYEGIGTTGRVIELATTKIARYKDQPRQYFDRELLDQLKASIAEQGQFDPIHVEEFNGNGPRGKTHGLVDGERRFQACSELDIPVLALVCKPKNENMKFLHSVTVNLNRAGHTPMEISRALRKIRAMPFIKKLKEGEQMSALGRIFGKSELWAWQHWGLNRLHDDLVKALEEKEMPVTLAVKLSGMPENLQCQLWNKIRSEGLKTAAAVRLINRTVEEHELTSSRRGRRPSDDWELLKGFVSRMNRGLDPFLELQAADQLEALAKGRNILDVRGVTGDLEGLIKRLQSVHDVLYSQHGKIAG